MSTFNKIVTRGDQRPIKAQHMAVNIDNLALNLTL